MSNGEDRQYPGTPAPEPRYGSLFAGTKGQRDQMRGVLYRARIHRLKRIAKKKGLPLEKQHWPPHG